MIAPRSAAHRPINSRWTRPPPRMRRAGALADISGRPRQASNALRRAGVGLPGLLLQHRKPMCLGLCCSGKRIVTLGNAGGQSAGSAVLLPRGSRPQPGGNIDSGRMD